MRAARGGDALGSPSVEETTPELPRISVLVCTRDRPEKLVRCVATILASAYRHFELLVIDQSTGNESVNGLASCSDSRLRYLRTPTRGLARSRNIGIQASRAPAVLFTDDDCLAESTWVEEMVKEFDAHPEVDAVYGRVSPYGTAPGKDGWVCPTTIEDDVPRVVSKLSASTHEAVGHGNNMAFRRRCFERWGLYQDWLGAGTPMCGGEDTDFTFRLLHYGATVRYSPKPRTWHDNWMRIEDSVRQLKGYKMSGAVVFMGFLLRGSGTAGRVLLHFWTSHFNDFRASLKWRNWSGTRHHLQMLFCLARGSLIGVLFTIRRPRRYVQGERSYPWTEITQAAPACGDPPAGQRT